MKKAVIYIQSHAKIIDNIRAWVKIRKKFTFYNVQNGKPLGKHNRYMAIGEIL